MADMATSEVKTQKPLLSLDLMEADSMVSQNTNQPSIGKGIIFLLVLTLAFAIIGIGLSVFNFMNCDNLFHEKNVCFPCSELHMEPFHFQEDMVITRTTSNEEDLCCAQNLRQLARLIELKTEKITRVAMSQRNTRSGCKNKSGAGCNSEPSQSSRTVAAHVVLSANQDQQQVDDNAFSLRGWSSRINPSFLEKVGLRGDRLLIPETGLYYVYSQLTMVEYHDDPDSVPTRDARKVAGVAHNIRRWNDLYPEEEVLLRRSQSKTIDWSKPLTEYVSYIGGVMPLKVGDELFITVSDPSLVQPDTKATYFGLYKI